MQDAGVEIEGEIRGVGLRVWGGRCVVWNSVQTVNAADIRLVIQGFEALLLSGSMV